MRLTRWQTLMVLLITLTYSLHAQRGTTGLPIGKWIQKIEKESSITINYDASILTDDVIYLPSGITDTKKIISYLERNTNFAFSFIDERTALLKTDKRNQTFDPVDIKFFVYDSISHFPLSDVNISIPLRNKHLVSGSDGKVNSYIKCQMTDIVYIDFVGYERLRFSVSSLADFDTVWMSPSNHTLVELIVTDHANEKIVNNATTINISKISAMAGVTDKDPLAMVQTIPGVVGLGESASNLSIRASTQDQNLIQWNDIPIYHTGHYVGLMSSINAYVVDEIEVFHDGFNSKFGNRVAGVVDMKSMQRHPSKPRIDLLSNLLTSNLHVELPLMKDKVSIELAGRTSYAGRFKNITYQRFFNQSFQIGRITEIRNYIDQNNLAGQLVNKSNVVFSDFNAHLFITPTKKDLISFSFLSANDLVENSLTFDWTTKIEVDSINLKNSGYNIKWKHKFNKELSWVNMYTMSGFTNSYRYHEDATKIVTNNRVLKQNNVHEFKYHTSLSWHRDNIFIDLGLENRQIENLNESIFVPNDIYNKDSYDNKTATLTSAFLHYQYKASSTFIFDIGSRLTKYSLNNKFYFEPRASITQQLSKRLKMRISSGKYTQVLTQIEEYNNLQVEDLFWRIADGKEGNELVPFINNTQHSMTFIYDHLGWQWSAGIYHKKLESITALGLEFDQSVNPWWIATGIGKGFESMVKKTWKNASLMLTYTYADLVLDFGGDRVFPAPYNHPNNLNIMYSQSVKRFEFSMMGRWKTGRPYSQYKEFKLNTNQNGDPEPVFDYDTFFDLRLPSYMRVDFTCIYKLYNSNKWKSNIGISAINLWNRDNILFRSHYVNYSNWPEITPATFDKRGLGFTPNVFFEISF